MDRDTDVQSRGNTNRETVWGVVVDPLDFGEEKVIERLSLDVASTDSELLERFAAYRNALAAVQDKTLRRKWTRKSLAESMLAGQCDALRQQLADMFAAVGDLPRAPNGPEDKGAAEAMEKYARRVLAWDKKLPK
jgi:hypothetical protein